MRFYDRHCNLLLKLLSFYAFVIYSIRVKNLQLTVFPDSLLSCREVNFDNPEVQNAVCEKRLFLLFPITDVSCHRQTAMRPLAARIKSHRMTKRLLFVRRIFHPVTMQV